MSGRIMMAVAAAVVLGVLVSGDVRADSILLDDGTTVSGTIVREGKTRVVIQTRFGRKSYPLRRIKSIVRDSDMKLPPGTLPDAVLHFHRLEVIEQAIANGKALYALGRYDEAIRRLAPLLDTASDKGARADIQWVLVESYERLAEFDKAIELLEELKAHGRKQDQIRATAHLDIFEQNPPDRSLRRVGRRATRKFLERADRIRAKAPNALADKDLMRMALEEYCYQILSDKKVSIAAWQKSLDSELTLEALREMPKRAGNLEKYLPFVEERKRVEESLDRVDAILPGYALSYRTDLVVKEAIHLYTALVELFRETVANYPDYTPPADESGRLTKEGREEWRRRCEDFVDDLRPILIIAKYSRERVARYPENLRRLNEQYENMIARLEEVRAATIRKKERSRV